MLLENIYSRPYRVYICFLLLIIAGIICYRAMPVALFPNSAKPEVQIWISFDKYTKDEFLNTYGKNIESSLKRLQSLVCEVDQVEAYYYGNGVRIEVTFQWGNDAIACLKEVEQVLLYYKSQWPENMRHGSWVRLHGKNVGFFLASFHSEKRQAEEIYDILNELISPKIASIKEADKYDLYNPSETQATITLDPLKMAAFKLLPEAVFAAIRNAVKSYNGGVLHNNAQTIIVEVAPQVKIVEQLSEILIPTAKNQSVVLTEIADINLKVNVINSQILKIDGNPAIVLDVIPVAGKNIKNMCDQVLAIVHDALQSDSVPADIKFEILVNPGDFINDSIANIMREVWLCSFIAVVVLFIFIGSFSGTLTTLLEIPISIILSFILMKLTNIQINLISLGGLALSVGMNVDASVVVIDAIIKKLGGKSFTTQNDIIQQVAMAVREVFTPIILATITSLIVFIPLIFTSELTYAILGDLAKVVIYSHSLSLFIAILLVPTIRIHLASSIRIFAEKHRVAVLDVWLNKLYDFYFSSLQIFLAKKKLRNITYTLIILSILSAFVFIPPRLTREIISPPDTDIIVTDMTFPGSAHISQMEEKVAEYEQLVQDKYGKDIAFIFSGINQINEGWSALLLKNKSKFKTMFSNVQELTKGSTEIYYKHRPFNPSELPIPHLPDWRIEFISSDINEANNVMDYFKIDLREADIVENIDINIFESGKYLIKPFTELFQKIQKLNYKLQPSDLGDILSLTNKPNRIDKLTINNKDKDIVVMFPENLFTEDPDIKSLPIPVGEKVVPLRALADFELLDSNKSLVRIDNENSFRLEGELTEKEKKQERKILAQIKQFTKDFKTNTLKTISSKVAVNMVDAKVELTKAIHELMITTLLSLVLIFLVLYLRFSSIIHTLIIMLAIPFGILGVFLSLWVFDSTLSLNSALGIILLNGITVANSIMLVDKILKHRAKGEAPLTAILLTAKERIRPILMTSIITILGMLPIALGFGEGGKVLQPLGIAVSGGLWVSLIFTLYVIPALELKVLNRGVNS